MQIVQKIRCPNCGSEGERHYLSSSQMIRTQCPTCDYLMVMCSQTGKVIEAYAPGIDAQRLTLRRPELSTSRIRVHSTGVAHTYSDVFLLQNVAEGLDAARGGSMVVRVPDRIVGN